MDPDRFLVRLVTNVVHGHQEKAIDVLSRSKMVNIEEEIDGEQAETGSQPPMQLAFIQGKFYRAQLVIVTEQQSWHHIHS